MTTPEPIRRTGEIEEPTNIWLIHPLSALVARGCARIGVTPNVVSLTGMASGLLAGYAYHHIGRPAWIVAGFVLMVVWHVMDGADGQLARMTHAQSELGRVMDGICDYVTFTAVYIGLAAALVPSHGAGVWLLAIVSGICHAAQAAAYETQRQDYNFWVWQRGTPPAQITADRHGAANGHGIAGLLSRGYTRLQLWATGTNATAQMRLAASLARADPATWRAQYRAVFARSVHLWSILCANYRTIAIFAFAIAGRSIWYFWFEILALGAAHAALLASQPARTARFWVDVGSGNPVSPVRPELS